MAKLLNRPYTNEEKMQILDTLRGNDKQNICLDGCRRDCMSAKFCCGWAVCGGLFED